MGFCLSEFLHRGSLFYTRVYHAIGSAALGSPQWIEKQSEAITVHGTDVHRYLFWFCGTLRVIRYEPDAIVVF